MNKKVLTLCAGFLLAGGLFSTANAIDLRDAKAGQFYQLKRVSQYGGATPGWSAVNIGDYYAVNLKGEIVLSNSINDRNSYWTIETKTNETGIKVVRLVNVYTGKALSVKTQDGKSSTEWFEVKYHQGGTTPNALNTSEDANELVWGDQNNEQINYLAVKDGNQDGDWEFTSATVAEASTSIYLQGLNAIPVEPTVLTWQQLNANLGNSFGLKICYQPLKNDGKIDADKEPVPYDAKGNVFAGVELYASDVDDDGKVELRQENEKGKRIVLLKEKWGNISNNLKEDGYKFAALTNKEYEAAENILAEEFIISQPATKDGAPLEVVAVDEDGTKYELVVSGVDGTYYVTTSSADPNGNGDGDNVADYTADEVTNAHNTYVMFGIDNLVDYTKFYGKLWNIAKDGDVASPYCYGETYIPAAQVALNYPEGQWLYNAKLDLDNDGVAEGAFVNRESGKLLTLSALRTVEGKADTYVMGNATYSITYAGDPSDNSYDGYLNKFTEDELKRNAFFIGTPIISTGDTVWLSKAANGKLEFSGDKNDAVEFRLAMQDFDSYDNKSFKDAKIITEYTIWDNQAEKTIKNVQDVLNFHQYKVTDAVSGEVLYYDYKNQRFALGVEGTKEGEVTAFDPIIFKNKGVDLYNLLVGQYYYDNKDIYHAFVKSNDKDGADEQFVTTPRSSFCDLAYKLFGAHNANELVWSQYAYNYTQNDMFVLVDASANQYRGDFSNTGVLDTIKIFRNDDNSYVLYEKGALLTAEDGKTALEGFLGMENINDPEYADMHAAMLADTAIHANTFRPQYMLAVDADIVPAGKWCEEHQSSICAHAVPTDGYVTGRYLVNLVDSAKAATKAGVKFADNKFVHEYYVDQNTPYYRLGFVQAKHIGDSLIIASTSDTIDLKNTSIDKVCTFAFRYVDAERDAFTIETLYNYELDDDGDIDHDQDKQGYIKYQNGVPVVTPKASEAWVFDLNETSEIPTANESINAANAAVSVVATDGAVIVKGAEGKNVIVSTILGKVVANEVLNSDNETIAAPAGIVVVSVDGESFKVAVK